MRKAIRPHFLYLALLCAMPASAQHSESAFDHGRFDRLLAEHVTPNGLVDYQAFRASEDFSAYLASLASVDMAPLPQPERLAIWINAYNAYTIELINRHDETESIRNINKALGFLKGKGPWNERFAEVAGYTYTLDEIEHEVIRPRFGEPRIHFALVCAAMGCPPLRREAYRAPDLDAQLEDQGRVFLRDHDDKNRVDVGGPILYLSPIFDWYREDFPEARAALGRYLARFFPDGPERGLLDGGRFEVVYTDYDWSLNVVP